MRPWIIVIGLSLLLSSAAFATFNGCPPGFCAVKSSGGGGGTNFILLVDASSHLLQTDNSSHICKAGGC